MGVRKARPKGIDNPGLSHGVMTLAGCKPASHQAVESGEQCQTIHPDGFDEQGLPCQCLWCDHGNVAGERIAAQIDYGSRGDDTTTEATEKKFRPKARHRLKKSR
jgi:hypothetical protein